MTIINALLTTKRHKHDLFKTPKTNQLKTSIVHFTSVKLIKSLNLSKKLKTSII